MADWTKPFTAGYSWWRVDRKSFRQHTNPARDFDNTGIETEQVLNITKGTLQLNDNTATFETGNVSCVGMPDVGTDLIRCYLDATWDDGTTEHVPLGTYNVSVPSRDVRGSFEECNATLDGRLIELQQDVFEEPIYVQGGYDIGWMTGMALNRNITFDKPQSYTAELVDTRTGLYVYGIGASADDDGTVLSAFNDIAMNALNLRAANTDPYGRIQLRRPIDYDGEPVWSFVEGENATFLKNATDERDTTGVCNVVVCVYESDSATVVGVAEDTDPDSPWSIANYGRRKCAVYTYSEEATQQKADEKAARLLEENRSIVRRVTISHVYCPARVGDIVEVSYPSAGIYGKFAIRTQDIEIGSAGCMTTSELRRFERA